MVKKVVLIVCGAVALLIGLPLLAGGIALLAVGGRSGTLISGAHPVSTSTAAFVADPQTMHDTGDVPTKISGATLRVEGVSTQPTFIGVAPAAQVNDFLSGTSYDQITRVDFSPFALSLTRVNGSAHPAAPGDQSFWVAQASGTAPELSWKVTDGYLLVVMNADGSDAVSLSVRMGVSSSVIFESGLGLTIFGGLLVVVGVLLLIWGIMTKRRPAMVPGYPYPPGTGYPGAGYPGPGYPGPGYPGAGQPPGPGYPGPGYPGTPSVGYPGAQVPGYPAPPGYPPAGAVPGEGYQPGPPSGEGAQPGAVPDEGQHPAAYPPPGGYPPQAGYPPSGVGAAPPASGAGEAEGFRAPEAPTDHMTPDNQASGGEARPVAPEYGPPGSTSGEEQTTITGEPGTQGTSESRAQDSASGVDGSAPGPEGPASGADEAASGPGEQGTSPEGNEPPER